MGMGGISIWQLLIVLAIVVMVFGTKRLRNMGGDLGSAIKGFRSAMRDGDSEDANKSDEDPQVIDQASEARVNADASETSTDSQAHKTKERQ